MNRPNEQMLEQLKKVVLIQRTLHEALDDFVDLLSHSSLNEEMREVLEDEVASLALHMDANFNLVEPDMEDLNSLMRLLGSYAP